MATTMGTIRVMVFLYAQMQDDEKKQVYFNTISAFKQMGDHVLPVVFSNDDTITRYCKRQNVITISKVE